MLYGSDMFAVHEGELMGEKERLNLRQMSAGRYTLSGFPCCRNNLNLATVHV